MRIVVGHANPDFDAYASMVAGTKLYPGSRAVFLGSQNNNVRSFHNLHEEFLAFTDLKGLDLDAVDSVVMVDTRDPGRIGEIGRIVSRPGLEVVVYDHHPPQEGDMEGADEHVMEVGATTSILVHEIRARGIELTPLEASVMLLGIHEDTGSLTYPGSTAYDADAAAYLMASGADLEVLNQFMARTLDASQRALLEQLQGSLQVWNINGQDVAIGVAEASEYVDSASVLTHYIVEDMGYRVAIGIVRMPERVQIVARSRLAEVDVGAIMERVGGGGHPQAASAGFRELSAEDALSRLRAALEAEVHAPLKARDVMSAPVRTVTPDQTMHEAAELMAKWGHGGLPVIEGEQIAGLVTRKDVDKALRHGLDHAPVKGFMSRDILTAAPGTDLSALEEMLASKGIGRVPIVEQAKLLGIVTRKDVLRAEYGDAYLDRRLGHGHPKATERFLGGVESLLPEEVREAITALGDIAQRRGERAHVVGGFVRDMILGRRNLDVDVVVEGDGVAFAEQASAEIGVRIKAHRRFGTAVLVFSREFHVDVASSRSEFYTKPGALPTVERSTLRQDLLRRDFTINAMAACIDAECLGLIADPFGGLKDLEAGVVRVLHALSFVDDPTRILRAARFECRYGFRLDRSSRELAQRSLGMGLLGEVSGARIREELIDIFDEARPAEVLSRLDELGALAAILPQGADKAALLEQAAQVESAIDAVGVVKGRQARTRHVMVTLCASSSGSVACDRWIRHYRFGREYAEVTEAACSKQPTVLRTLQDKRGMRDSRLFHALNGLPVDALAVLWIRGDVVARERIERFCSRLAGLRPSVSGNDLIEAGYEPGELFTSILARALDDRLDGRAVGRKAELANLHRVATRLLGKPMRGDSTQ